MHHLLLSLATTPTPLPTPGLRDGLSEDQVTPGLLGFIMTAFFVLATALLIVDMVRRIRKVRYRAQVEEEKLAAAAAADVAAADAHDHLDTAEPAGFDDAETAVVERSKD
ncbi:hypothetical protein PSET11_01983 [Arthrobacter ulcerisalmonis]|uniref:Uncharacterized protein n=1 Tax=Arthrobacter ulcerisalmonis TaxID=2483813 RepID=A0A3P5XJ15_9MICC|nr:hypothetical protein [Arthrobacter ulcerisalmonis]VDC27671.1 hypothetical protein PSET11_01983 [Arthrobacter ulcerisalmonis]